MNKKNALSNNTEHFFQNFAIAVTKILDKPGSHQEQAPEVSNPLCGNKCVLIALGFLFSVDHHCRHHFWGLIVHTVVGSVG